MISGKLFLGLVTRLALVAAGCAAMAVHDEPSAVLSSLSDDDLKAVMIRFERTACYGICPAYVLTIQGDGRIEYEGKEHVRQKGLSAARIGTEDLKKMLREFTRAKFFSIVDEYSEQKCACVYCTDMPNVITEISLKSITHKISHYHGCTCAPKSLFELEAAIDKAANSERWIGNVSKQGPFGYTCFKKRPK